VAAVSCAATRGAAGPSATSPVVGSARAVGAAATGDTGTTGDTGPLATSALVTVAPAAAEITALRPTTPRAASTISST
jgi:hypothetical protein